MRVYNKGSITIIIIVDFVGHTITIYDDYVE